MEQQIRLHNPSSIAWQRSLAGIERAGAQAPRLAAPHDRVNHKHRARGRAGSMPCSGACPTALAQLSLAQSRPGQARRTACAPYPKCRGHRSAHARSVMGTPGHIMHRSLLPMWGAGKSRPWPPRARLEGPDELRGQVGDEVVGDPTLYVSRTNQHTRAQWRAARAPGRPGRAAWAGRR